MTERISGPSAVSSAWSTFKKNWKFIIPAGIATLVIMILLQMLQKSVQDSPIIGLIFALISVVIGIAIALGWSQVILKLVRHQHVDWDSFKTNTNIWFPYFVARLILGVFMFLSLLLIGVPLLFIIGSAVAASVSLLIIGIIIGIAGIALFLWIGIRYMFISFVAIDKNVSGWKIMKESARLTKGHIVELFVFGLFILLINIVGLLLLVVGLAITIPLSKIATGYVYEHLKGKHEIKGE